MTAATAEPTTDDQQGYSARHLSVLEGLEAVRKRPGMYIGSTDSRGLAHCLWEIVDNSVDEALAGHCTHISVVMRADGSFEVGDNGRGIPVDIEPKTGLPGVELVMTRLHAGGKFGGVSYTASGGLHGVGASVVNALSARLDVEVDREGHTNAISFKRGLPGVFADEGRPNARFKKSSGVRQIRRVARRTTGTRTRFWPDLQIFLPDATVEQSLVLDRMRQTAFLIPGLTIEVRDERGEETVHETFCFEGGIGEYCTYLAKDAAISDVLRLQGRGRFTETVPVLDGQGHLTPTDVERELEVDIALRWGGGYDTTMRSFVNVIATPKGGTHLRGFERSLARVLNEQLRAARLLKASDDDVIKEDALEGLTAVVTVRLPEPQFEGQTKEILGTSAATRIVGTVVSKELKEIFENPGRGQKPQLRAVLEKVVGAAKTRIAARTQRDNQRRKNALENSALPAKLVDCRATDDRSELFIVEGDSALGTAKLARNSEFQALLPIRGKILNVQKASVADMLKNTECAAIIQVLGAGSGRTFDLDAARYGRAIIMADADVDGSHIRCLLLTLFHRYMRPMLEAGRVFSAVPPLHRIELVRPKRGQDKYIYTYSDAELRRRLVELERKGQSWKEPIQRYKGLGEMDADQLAETTLDPQHRILRRIRIEDAEEASKVFDLLMGSEVAPRRAFITAGASELDTDRIDT
ncbi:DNA gyrase/topoisomerase IV subunit B [Actinomadura parmotrematis]|uniref:DNA topoisomerase (ATP-hydrolyzing) n=1 Tax=Actinomadura parmotrematis TaxID=2864039 RepID=A0ABS7FWV8_9ACTN|nr:DNA topoisomerase IV subunit B [Actinomadura parmotrematis]MBW8484911.1 type IIA DNA topoisomerase subunit B [Actinomadura parmotrematis]